MECTAAAHLRRPSRAARASRSPSAALPTESACGARSVTRGAPPNAVGTGRKRWAPAGHILRQPATRGTEAVRRQS